MAVFGNLWNGSPRPLWAGGVTIQDATPGKLSTDAVDPVNPRIIIGIVVPVSTKGRPSAPSPQSGMTTGKAMGTDKGHMMGLELGGPDVSENIVPQSSLWQQSGGWRYLERQIQQAALELMEWSGPVDPTAAAFQPAPRVALGMRISPDAVFDTRGEPGLFNGIIWKVSIGTHASMGPGGGHVSYTHTPMAQGQNGFSRQFIIRPEGLSWQ